MIKVNIAESIGKIKLLRKYLSPFMHASVSFKSADP